MAAGTSTDRFEYCGVNHVALVARDMAETVDFYTNVLEMKLVKTVEFPDGRGQHFFFDCGGGGTIAFFWFPDAPPVAPGIASMHDDILKNGSQTAHAKGYIDRKTRRFAEFYNEDIGRSGVCKQLK